MRLERIPEHALSRATDLAIGELMDKAFGPSAGFNGRSFHKMRHHLRVVAWEGDQLASHVALQQRAIRIDETVVTVAAIAEVATDPQFQGRGVGSELMRHAIDAARTSLAEFAVLFGHPGLYAPIGFRHQPNRLTYVEWGTDCPTGVVTETIDSLMVLQLGPDPWNASANIDLCGPLF